MINILEDEKLDVLNHSCAHLLAHAIKNLYPKALFWVGPVIEEGFYYDIDLGDEVIQEEDLEKIEREMKKIAKSDKLIKRLELSKEEAREMFKGDLYKQDLLDRMEDDNISAYSQGDFIDLCRGPHAKSTKELKHFKLLKVSGAYWKADANNKMLQRVYGICFDTEERLNEYLNFLEEAKKRDHKKLGRELDLFMMSDYGAGFPFFLPNGMMLRNELEHFWYEEHEKEGYKFIKTPIMLSQELWELSGHWLNYRENMYTSSIDEKLYAIKPMNCPGGMLVFKNSLHSYKDLPLRLGELGLVHRHEASGALNGLFRVRSFTQDDAHLYMMESQVEEEIVRLAKFLDRIYAVFGLSYHVKLSTRPEKYIGEISAWEKSEKALANALESIGQEFTINPGDGAFYGPKLDFYIKDSLGRIWQCATFQLDMNLPERFDLNYIDSDGSKKRPVMIHRTFFGSLERFIGVLIEHFAGLFPLWLAPVQVNIIPVNNEYHLDYAKEIYEDLKELGVRVKLDDRNEKLSYKMRESQTKKINLSLILGDKEKDSSQISYRHHNNNETISLSKEEFYKFIKEKIESKALDV